MRPKRFALCFLAVLVGVAGYPGNRRPLGGAVDPELDRGWQVYDANCAICHGARGNGDGRIADQFRRRPQSFRTAKFKFRSTSSGSLPLDEDFFRTVTQGIARTGMVPYDYLPEADRRAVVKYVKTFSSRFETERPGPPISIPRAPNTTPDLAARGRAAYLAAGCVDCHGEAGKGKGSVPTLKDDWGQAMLPSDLNLTLLPRKSGPTPADLYRTIATGLDGTPMPSYADALTPEVIWAIVMYVETLPPDTQWTGLPEGPGAELVRWRCTVCHNLDGPNLPRQDHAGWTETVEMMIRWGAPIRANERERIIRYLVEHSGPVRSP